MRPPPAAFLTAMLLAAGCASDWTPLPPAADLSLRADMMRADILEAAKSAFAYTVLGDARLKDGFVHKLDDFDSQMENILVSGALDLPECAAAKAAFEPLRRARSAFETRALAYWDGYEADGAASPAEGAAFKSSVKDLCAALDTFTGAAFSSLTQTQKDSYRPLVAAASMRGDMLEAAQNALAFQIVGDKACRDEAHRKMADFSAAVGLFERTASLSAPRGARVKALLGRALRARTDFDVRMASMFAAYERAGKPDPEAVAVFLAVSSDFNRDLEDLVAECVAAAAHVPADAARHP